MIWTAISQVIPFAVGAALNPITITFCLLILLSERGRTNGPAFALGVFLTAFAVVAAAYLLTQAADVDSEEAVSDGVDLMQLGFGVLLLWAAYRKWSKRPAPGETPPRPKVFDSVGRLRVHTAFVAGVVAWAANIKSIPLAVSAGARLSQGPTDGTDSLIVLLVFALVASIFVVVPVIVLLVRGDKATAGLQSAEAWVLANLTAIVVTVLVILGGILVGQGLAVFG